MSKLVGGYDLLPASFVYHTDGELDRVSYREVAGFLTDDRTSNYGRFS